MEKEFKILVYEKNIRGKGILYNHKRFSFGYLYEMRFLIILRLQHVKANAIFTEGTLLYY